MVTRAGALEQHLFEVKPYAEGSKRSALAVALAVAPGFSLGCTRGLIAGYSPRYNPHPQAIRRLPGLPPWPTGEAQPCKST